MNSRLAIKRGESYRLRLVLTSSNLEQVIDLTGAAAKLDFRPKPDSHILYYEASTENGRLVIDGNEIVLTMSQEETSAFTFDHGAYDLFIRFDSGKSKCLLEGIFEVRGRVTQC